MQRITIKDIAAAAGVSHTTVSYVLNKNPNQKISDKTRRKVIETARNLNYIPNENARSLRSDSTHCITVALEKSITHTRFSGILQGIREELGKEGYGLLLTGFQARDNMKNPYYLDSVLQRRADGIIYISSDGLSPACSKNIETYNLPFVACDCCPDEESLASVSFDYEKGAFEVACRLFGEGSKRILYWQPDAPTFQETYRITGLEKARELYPGTVIEVCKMPCIPDDASPNDRYPLIDDVCRQSLVQNVMPRLALFEEGDAVVCSWGVMVKHLCAALYQRNDKRFKIALLSDADIPVIPNIRVLTSRPGFIRGGRESAKLLLSQLRGEDVNLRVVLDPDPPTYVEL
ncbi:LacI family transcriptional regulator [Petralouisia muris]|uniref:LacI family transcriptional regulator n=1 Tax=Petralouisia muris TaxID=3032872 RepID=A0AC61S1W1_9FIRM|nr:LacI family DNA-binding transcriptional regulator [Petralouisia muris]TGY98379.1 LacI family transcriptional regulator [Petralouisia muris]